MAKKSTPTPIPAPTAEDLLDRLRALPSGDDDDAVLARINVLRHAYRTVFGSTLGRLVLADIANSAGIGEGRGPEMPDRERTWNDGRCDMAKEIAATAGFGPEAMSVYALTETLEGQDHDAPGERSEPEPIT